MTRTRLLTGGALSAIICLAATSAGVPAAAIGEGAAPTSVQLNAATSLSVGIAFADRGRGKTPRQPQPSGYTMQCREVL